MSPILLMAITLGFGFAEPASPAPSQRLQPAPVRSVGDACLVDQTRHEVMDVVVKRDGVELTAGQGQSTIRDRFGDRVAAVTPAGKALTIVRRYTLATRYRAHTLPTGKATFLQRPIVGRDIRVSLSRGIAVVVGAGKADSDDMDGLRNALDDDPSRLLSPVEQAVGSTWAMPADAFSTFDEGATGTGTCSLEPFTDGPGGPSARIRFHATVRSVDEQGRRQDGTVSGFMDWDPRLRRTTALQYESVFDVRYTTTRGATVIDVTGHGTLRCERKYTWTRIAARPARAQP